MARKNTKNTPEARRNFPVSRVTKQLAAQSPTYLETASFQIFREDHDLGRVDADSNEWVDVLMAQFTGLTNE